MVPTRANCLRAFFGLEMFAILSYASYPAAQESMQASVVFVQVGYEDNNAFIPVDAETGFLIEESGWVLTSKHVLAVSVPEGKTRVYYGSVGSRYTTKYPLFEVSGPVVSPNFELLRLPPALGVKWPVLNVDTKHRLSLSDVITAAGFPAGLDITIKTGVVINLLGPDGAIGTNARFVPGMSGAPVVLGNSHCVVGIVWGASPDSEIAWLLPTFGTKPLLDVAPAQPCEESGQQATIIPHLAIVPSSKVFNHLGVERDGKMTEIEVTVIADAAGGGAFHIDFFWTGSGGTWSGAQSATITLLGTGKTPLQSVIVPIDRSGCFYGRGNHQTKDGQLTVDPTLITEIGVTLSEVHNRTEGGC